MLIEQDQHYNSSSKKVEFNRITDSTAVPDILSNFQEFWPNEINNFKTTINKYPFIDLACGNYLSCFEAICNLSTLMNDLTIYSYWGIDRFNIEDTNTNDLIETISKSKNQGKNILLKQPDLLKNTNFYRSDMLYILSRLPSHSIKILSIGGFDQLICKLNSPYRVDLKTEIKRTLALDAYFLCAGSSLDVELTSDQFNIREIVKQKTEETENIYCRTYFGMFKLYKTSGSLQENTVELTAKLLSLTGVDPSQQKYDY